MRTSSWKGHFIIGDYEEMKKVVKKQRENVKAYQLGKRNPVLDNLIEEGKIIPLSETKFEIMSREAANGNTGHGQIAKKGDYIKIDSEGYPYPNESEWFKLNHRWIQGNEYEQIPQLLYAWAADQPICTEIEFLIREKGLIIKKDDDAHYFTAPLWGTIESAPKTAVIIFYSIVRNDTGEIIDADFNFVSEEEFIKNYEVC